MLWRWLIVAVVCASWHSYCVVLAERDNSIPATTGLLEAAAQHGDSLANLITEQRKEKNLVGLAAMVMVDGKVVAAAAHGERKKGSGVPARDRRPLASGRDHQESSRPR